MSEEMSKRELALFNLGKSLVELLGEELAIANLTLHNSNEKNLSKSKGLHK